VDIYDTHESSKSQIQKNQEVEEMSESKVKEYLKKKSDNVISYREDTQNDNENRVYNRTLSGWYVITDMKISYNTVRDFKGGTYKKLQTHLTLNRIDYKPSFHSEYEMAKKAIEKYKSDNISENIMQGGDIM
jgi:hypothetical protein